MPDQKLLAKKLSMAVLFLLLVISLGLNLEFINNRTLKGGTAQNFQLDDQAATIQAINMVKPAVVSIAVYGKRPVSELNIETGKITQNTARVKIASGSGFIISSDGLILTNKHVVGLSDQSDAEYRIILNSGKEYYAQFIGENPANDLAVLKIFDKDLPFVKLGESDKMVVGSTVLAIGNALGQYQNTVTKGIISGLGRSVVAAGEMHGDTENLDNVIQTDAEINPGNSGGPLINLKGEVVGINTAIDQAGSSIGFAIPIDDAKQAIASVTASGKISVPHLGVRYTMITEDIARENKLAKNYGAWITSAEKELPAIIPDSPAAQAGLQDGDIIYEVDGVVLGTGKTLLSRVQRYKPNQRIGFKVQRGEKVLVIIATLDEFK